jgi:streptomycin 6-kinase
MALYMRTGTFTSPKEIAPDQIARGGMPCIIPAGARWETATFAAMDVPISASLDWWRAEPGGPEWLGRLPRLVTECAERWSLQLGAPYESHASWVAPATRADGTRAVLKVNFPDEDSEHEAHALAEWGGRSAVRLLEHEPTARALLIERCEPGTQLWSVPDDDEATHVGASVLRRIWAPPADEAYRTLAVEAARWAEDVPARWEAHGRPFERGLVDEVVAWIRALAPSQPELIVAHQDLHGGNVLRAKREPWLVIDPKPLLAERAFDTASLIRDRRPWLMREPHPERRLARRLDLVASELDLDRERMRGWGIVHAVAWDGDPAMLECARLLSRIRP